MNNLLYYVALFHLGHLSHHPHFRDFLMPMTLLNGLINAQHQSRALLEDLYKPHIRGEVLTRSSSQSQPNWSLNPVAISPLIKEAEFYVQLKLTNTKLQSAKSHFFDKLWRLNTEAWLIVLKQSYILYPIDLLPKSNWYQIAARQSYTAPVLTFHQLI